MIPIIETGWIRRLLGLPPLTKHQAGMVGQMKAFDRMVESYPSDISLSKRYDMAEEDIILDKRILHARERTSDLYLNEGFGIEGARRQASYEEARAMRAAGYEDTVVRRFKEIFRDLPVFHILTQEAADKLHREATELLAEDWKEPFWPPQPRHRPWWALPKPPAPRRRSFGAPFIAE